MSLLNVNGDTNYDRCQTCHLLDAAATSERQRLRFASSRTKTHGSQAFSLQGNPKSVAPAPPGRRCALIGEEQKFAARCQSDAIDVVDDARSRHRMCQKG